MLARGCARNTLIARATRRSCVRAWRIVMGEASPTQCMRCRRAQAPSSCTPVQRFLVAAAVISSARERIRGSRRDPRWARPPASVGGKVEGASRPTFHTHTSKSQHQRGRQLTKASQHTHGISRAKSFDLEVTPWAPARLTSSISHPGPEGSYGASTLPPGPAQPPSASNFPPNRPTSLCCTLAAFPGPEASTWR